MQMSCIKLGFRAAIPAPGLHSVRAIAPSPRSQPGCHSLRQSVLVVGTFAALGLSTVCIGAHAESARASVTAPRDPYAGFIEEASRRFAIPVSWLRAVMQVESGGNARAVSPKGAMGLMQLMPGTWSELRQHYHLGDDPFDPHDNILGGAAYLRELFDRFGASGFLAAYNVGPSRFEDYLAGLRPLKDETKRYLSTLAQMLPKLPVGGGTTAIVSAGDWRVAGLFAGSPAATPPSNGTPSRHPSGDVSTGSIFALTPQSNGLFVPVSAAHR